MKIPSQITIGDTPSWIDSPTSDNLGNSLSSSAWTLKYALRGKTVLDITADAQSDGSWKSSLTAVQSAALLAGTYYWQAYVTNGSTRHTLGEGKVNVKADFATISTANYDGRTQARKDLDAVQAAIRALTTGGAVAEYKIGNRELKKMSVESLLVLESRYKLDVAREERAQKINNGEGDPFTLKVRF